MRKLRSYETAQMAKSSKSDIHHLCRPPCLLGRHKDDVAGGEEHEEQLEHIRPDHLCPQLNSYNKTQKGGGISLGEIVSPSSCPVIWSVFKSYRPFLFSPSEDSWKRIFTALNPPAVV